MMSNAPSPTMNIIEFSELMPIPDIESLVTIGNFDGVHRGHQAIIQWMVEEAQRQDKSVIVVTFYPNPSNYFNPQAEPNYLSTPEEKEATLLALGVNSVITFRFDKDFAELSPMTFLTELHQKIGLNVLVVGQDFALGKNRQGTIPVLESIGEELAFSVRTIPTIRSGSEEVSSTKIRQSLDEGNVAAAGEMLGRPYMISGIVSHGADRGSKIGLPTANILHWSKKKLPAVGVYVTGVFLHGERFLGITNVGYRPTFEDQELPNVETHILDFDGNIYGENLQLQFIEKIREEQKFSGVDAFLAQIERDKVKARKIFSNEKK